MDRHPIVLRAANPAFDEGLAFARYADEAAEGFFRFMLGRRAGYIIGHGVRPARPRPLLPECDFRRTGQRYRGNGLGVHRGAASPFLAPTPEAGCRKA